MAETTSRMGGPFISALAFLVTATLVASTVVVANQVDIDAGELAESRADHTGVHKQAVALVTKPGVTPQDNPTRQSLKKGDHEVACHRQVLDAFDKTLIPSAQNAELKALLVAVRPAFLSHLEHARQIQAASAKCEGAA